MRPVEETNPHPRRSLHPLPDEGMLPPVVTVGESLFRYNERTSVFRAGFALHRQRGTTDGLGVCAAAAVVRDATGKEDRRACGQNAR